MRLSLKKWSTLALALLLLSSVASLTNWAVNRPARSAAPATYDALSQPLHFEANVGQADPSVLYLAHAAGYSLYFTDQETTMVLNQQPANASQPTTVLRFQLQGANLPASPVAEGKLAGVSNYLLGNDRSQWLHNVPNYERVSYHNVYPGVDLVYYGSSSKLEYDFVVAPGADLSPIRLKVAGAGQVAMEGNELVIRSAAGELRQAAPRIYQDTAAGRVAVTGGYNLVGGGEYGFDVAAYDHSRALVIDPIIYSTYLGGGDPDGADAVAIDSDGSVYVCGATQSGITTPFPTTAGSFQPNFGQGTNDAFISKFSSSGSLVYSTFLGGQGQDVAYSIVVTNGIATVVGTTNANNFPTRNPIQASRAGGFDAFVSSLNTVGSDLIYSTYLGGSSDDTAYGVASDGNVYVTGMTQSSNFPTLNAAQPSYGGGISDAFVVKLDSNGARVYATYLGGSNYEDSLPSGRFTGAIAVDSGGNAYVVGTTLSTNFPTLNPYQAAFAGGFGDLFVTKLNSTGMRVYATYLGGGPAGSSPGDDYGTGIALDSANNIYLTGFTNGGSFPSTQPSSYAGGFDAFITKLNPTGSSLVYSRFLGGSGNDYANAIAVSDSGIAYVTGQTNPDFQQATNFPTVNADQSTAGGDTDAFVTEVNSNGTAYGYSSYLGGNSVDSGTGIKVDAAGKVYVVGESGSSNFVTVGAYQPNNAGSRDAFVTYLTVPTPPPAPTLPAATSTPGGSTPTPCSISFSDVPSSNLFYNDIQFLACRGVVSGSGGLFRPNDNSKRGEFAKIAVVGFGIAAYNPTAPTFRDVAQNNVFYGYIEAAAHAGAITGFTQPGQCPGGAAPCFLPNNNVTRAQVAIIVQRARNYPVATPNTPTFRDVANNNFAYAAIEVLANRGIINGAACSSGGGQCFRPNDNIRRGELSKVVRRAIESVP